jgi:hypothetical protein
VNETLTAIVVELQFDWNASKACRNPTFGRVWGWNSHFQNGDLGVHGDSRNFKVRLQGSKHLTWGVLYTIGKLLMLRCQKWARMSHLKIYSTSYGKKKGRESNWQFDSRPLKVKNQLDSNACKWSVIHHWKALNKNYKFASDLIPIKGLSKEL